MASSSGNNFYKYDVFLSFRGEDTRKNFVDHLYHALHNRGIITYKDDEKIEKGKRISEQLIRAIEESRFHIIVFSKNYASSSWCLEELVKIMECQKMTEHSAYPVFYDVEPTEVRHQSGAVGEAFAKHENGNNRIFFHCRRILLGRISFIKHFTRRVELDKEDDVGRWRKALKAAADLAGMDLKTTVNGHEAAFIRKLVAEISLKLHFINSGDDENLVGMETRVGNVVSSLEVGDDDVRMIGIKGMGGGGKTTLARAVFDHLSFLFEGKSFVENVAQVSESSLSGLKELQKQVLSNVLNDQSIVVESVADGKSMLKRTMRTRKVLIVLDDVGNLKQFDALAGNCQWFKPGSRIIITTRDEQVLRARRVNYVHDISLLSDEEAICLFSRYAFGKELPIEGYEELSGEVVSYAAGLPLTVKVLGSFLCDRTTLEWSEAVERLSMNLNQETMEKLQLSYDGLDNDLQQIFLDVACILKGEIKDEAIRILKSCGFNAEIGLRVLEQKSLITISNDGRLLLHDHIEQMGKNIVRRMHDEPQSHNRLWIKEEIEYILENDLGTGEIRCIKLKGSELHPAIIMKGLRKMNGLRFLYVDTPFGEVDEVDQYLPNSLQSLHWPGYPLECLPTTFRANKLADLAMVQSNICQLREGGEGKVLNKLKFLDLKYSNLRTFNLGVTIDLEMLDLKKCKHSIELDMPVRLLKLRFLNLSGSEVSNLDLGLTPRLERLTLSIKDIKHLPDSICMLENLKYLNLKSCLLLEKLPTNIRRLKILEELHLTDCLVLQGIPNDICMLEHLKYLKLTNCSRLERLPRSLGRLKFLEELYLVNCTSLRDIPNEICNMESLRFLHLPYCSPVQNLPEDLGSLECLKELNIEGAGISELPKSIFQMKGLRIVWARSRLESCGFTSLTEISEYTASCYV